MGNLPSHVRCVKAIGETKRSIEHGAWGIGKDSWQQAADRKTLGTRHFFLAASGK